MNRKEERTVLVVPDVNKAFLRTRVENDTAYHAPDDTAKVAHELLRDETLRLARLFVDVCPMGRELSLALTKLVDEAMAHANAAVARNHAGLDREVILDWVHATREGR